MPAQYLYWFPPIKAVGRPQFFVIGLLLPIAVLAAFGFDRILISLKEHQAIQIALTIALLGLLIFDYWSGEFPGESAIVNPFYEQLAHEPGDFGIIQLPMGRDRSKRYLFLQTIHQKSIVEGMTARTPAEAYDYILGNPLLHNWSIGESLDCSPQSQRRINSALDQLSRDDFRYVIVEQNDSEFPVQVVDSITADPIYRDNELSAFRLADLSSNPPCFDKNERVFDLPSPAHKSSISWDQKINLIGYDLFDIDQDSGILPITVYWQALTEMDDSYNFYLHLIDPENGSLVAQTDIIPRGWSYPTSSWMKGEIVEDTVNIPVMNVPSGTYELYIGWYDGETGDRLVPKSDQSRTITNNSILLAEIDI